MLARVFSILSSCQKKHSFYLRQKDSPFAKFLEQFEANHLKLLNNFRKWIHSFSIYFSHLSSVSPWCLFGWQKRSCQNKCFQYCLFVNFIFLFVTCYNNILPLEQLRLHTLQSNGISGQKQKSTIIQKRKFIKQKSQNMWYLKTVTNQSGNLWDGRQMWLTSHLCTLPKKAVIDLQFVQPCCFYELECHHSTKSGLRRSFNWQYL